MEGASYGQRGRLAGTALVCGAAATLCYAWGGVVTWWGHAVPRLVAVPAGLLFLVAPAFFLIAPGMRFRSSRARFAVAAFCTLAGSLFFVGARAAYSVNDAGGPPPPWPDFDTFGMPTLMAAVGCLCLGIVCSPGVPGRWWLKILSPLGAGVIVLGAAHFFQAIFIPREHVLLQSWEFATLLVGGPALCLLAWLPFDRMRE